MKRFHLLILIACSLFIAQPTLAFRDITTTTTYRDAILYLEEQGIIEGYADNTFRPTNTVTRAEFLAMIYKGQGITPEEKGIFCYADVAREWYSAYICDATSRGWVQGYEGNTFRPNEIITRAEGAKMLVEILGIPVLDGYYKFTTDIDNNAWYAVYANTVIGRQLLPVGTFQANKGLSRGELAEMLFRGRIVKAMDVPMFHPSQGSLFISKGYNPYPYTNSSSSSSSSYSWTTTTPYSPTKVRISTANSFSEEKIKSQKGGYYTIGNTTYYTGYQEKQPGQWDAVVLRFDNGQRQWARIDYETGSAQSYAYRIFEAYGKLYVAFAVNVDQGAPELDFRYQAKDGWQKSYGGSTGEFITVIGEISPETGALLRATYIGGVDPTTKRGKETYVWNITEGEGTTLNIEATTTGVPRKPDLFPFTEASTLPSPRPFRVNIPSDLSTANYVEAGSIRYSK